MRCDIRYTFLYSLDNTFRILIMFRAEKALEHQAKQIGREKRSCCRSRIRAVC